MAKQKKENSFADEIAVSAGKMPPNALDFEKIVIGQGLVEKAALDKLVFFFGDNHSIFYDPRHVVIWSVIFSMISRSVPVTIISLIMECKREEKLHEAGGDIYIIDICTGVSSSAHIEYHARVILEKYYARVIQNKCFETGADLFNESAKVFGKLDEIRHVVNDIEDSINKTRPDKNSRDLHAEMLERYKSDKGKLIPIDFNDLRDDIDGFDEGDFVVLGARPSQGKTAVALNFLTRTAKMGIPSAFFSLEMSAVNIHSRVAAEVCDVSYWRLSRKRLFDNELAKLHGKEGGYLETLPIQYSDSKTLFDIISKIRIMAKTGVKLFIVDYLQIVQTNGMKFGTREQEVAFISRMLKATALELKVVIIALAQVDKRVDMRPIKRPLASDLRESAAIEQDADIVILLYRPEFYGVKKWDDAEESSAEGQIELQFAKYRNGNPFTRKMRFWGDKMRLADLNTDSDYKNSSRDYADEKSLENNLFTDIDDDYDKIAPF